jgi:signal transduction histidine kinase
MRASIKPATEAGTNKQSLFTGASPQSRAFEIGTWIAAAVSGVAVVVVHPQAPFHSMLAAWPLVVATAIIGAAGVAVGAIYRLPFPSKIFLSLGSSASFALLLILPAQLAFPVAFAGTAAGQLLRRRRGDRLSTWTMAFNVAQYVVTWSVALAMYFRVAGEPFAATPDGAWVPAAASAFVYILFNTWVVSTWSALRRRAWAWDVWMRSVAEVGVGFVSSLALGAGLAVAAVAHPMYVVAVLVGFALAHVGLLQYQRVALRQHVLMLTAIVDAAERRSPNMTEHSERVSWWADRLARFLGLSQTEADEIAIAAKLHDLSSVALGAGNGLTDPVHAAFPADVLPYLPGFAPIARTLHAQSEYYDGTGGPEGLSGAAIPIASRIIAVAEHYVIASATAPTPEHALADLRRLSGTRLDPQIVDAVAKLAEEAVPWHLPIPALPQQQMTPAFATAAASAGAPAGFHSDWHPDAVQQTQVPAAAGGITPATILARLETERRRIGRELHDQVGAALTAVKCQLAAARHANTGDENRVLADTDELLTRTISQVQDLSSTLRPVMLDEHGLAAALESYITRYTRQTAVHVEFTHGGLEEACSPLVETAAFRIVQEALTNVARHARTDRARVVVRRTPEALTLSVADSGAGFDAGIAATATGLTGMSERAQLLGGTLTVRSAPGEGTTIEAVLPAWPAA